MVMLYLLKEIIRLIPGDLLDQFILDRLLWYVNDQKEIGQQMRLH